MSFSRARTGALFLLLGLASTAAQAATPADNCITTSEGEALAIVLVPPLVAELGQRCAGFVPPQATIRGGGRAFSARYAAIGNDAWPMAKRAMAKLASADMRTMLDDPLARTLAPAIAAPLVLGDFKTRDCGAIDHLLTQLAPLPPRNAASAIVTGLQLARSNDPRAESALPLCRYGQ